MIPDSLALLGRKLAMIWSSWAVARSDKAEETLGLCTPHANFTLAGAARLRKKTIS
jgi:hypothetical protein